MVLDVRVNDDAKENQHHADLFVHGLQAGLIDPASNIDPKLKTARSGHNVEVRDHCEGGEL